MQPRVLDREMGRGEHLRTKIKRELIASETVAIAVEEARQIVYQRAEAKKSLETSLREHIGKMIDRIDPLEVAAIVAMTITVHDTYDWTTSKLANIRMKSGPTILGLTRKGGPTGLAEFGEFLSNIPDPVIWLVSFISSFYILRHGKDIATVIPSVIAMLGL